MVSFLLRLILNFLGKGTVELKFNFSNSDIPKIILTGTTANPDRAAVKYDMTLKLPSYLTDNILAGSLFAMEVDEKMVSG
jgi:hypothetical protein